tara:strand:+ start:678 stop:929 length:252 start_codon:yes stop_codon:yes gene_type:complete
MTGFNNKVKEGNIVECVVMTPGGQTPAQLVSGKVVKSYPAKKDLVSIQNVQRILDGSATTLEECTRSYKPSRIMAGSLKKLVG